MIKIPSYVKVLLDRLEAADEEAYIVGGSLRDALLGNQPHDYDLATSALPEKTLALFSDMRVIETGIKHGTVTVLSDSNPVEVTTFRIDGNYTDSRHPDGVRFTDRIFEDLSRRDFTINAMAYSPTRGFVDVFGGKDDLDAGIIRAVREPEERFREDALRVLRAFRFSAQLSFSIEEKTLMAAKTCREGLSKLSAERIASELFKLVGSPSPRMPLLLMSELGISEYIFGKALPTRKTVDLLEQMQGSESERLGFLLCQNDPEAVRELLADLKCSGKQKTAVMAVIRGSSFGLGDRKDIGRFVAECGIYAPAALAASQLLGNSLPEASAWLSENRAPSRIGELAVSGRDMMALGAEGREIGELLESLFALCLENSELNERETLLGLARSKIKHRM